MWRPARECRWRRTWKSTEEAERDKTAEDLWHFYLKPSLDCPICQLKKYLARREGSPCYLRCGPEQTGEIWWQYCFLVDKWSITLQRRVAEHYDGGCGEDAGKMWEGVVNATTGRVIEFFLIVLNVNYRHEVGAVAEAREGGECDGPKKSRFPLFASALFTIVFPSNRVQPHRQHRQHVIVVRRE